MKRMTNSISSKKKDVEAYRIDANFIPTSKSTHSAHEVHTIDGSMLEGGGQILRMSMALAAATGKAVRIVNIRAKRERPGLQPQHLTGVELVCTMCSGHLEGNCAKSMELLFVPGELTGGAFYASPGTAGATTLLVQASLPGLLIGHALHPPSPPAPLPPSPPPHPTPHVPSHDSLVNASASASLQPGTSHSTATAPAAAAGGAAEAPPPPPAAAAAPLPAGAPAVGAAAAGASPPLSLPAGPGEPPQASSLTLLPSSSLSPSSWTAGEVGESSIRFVGGTDNPLAPPVDYLVHVLAPTLRRLFHIDLRVRLCRRGFYPRGGGEILMTLGRPLTAPAPHLQAVQVVKRGAVVKVHCRAFVSGNLPRHIPKLLLQHAVVPVRHYFRAHPEPSESLLRGGSPASEGQPQPQITSEVLQESDDGAVGTGAAVLLVATTSTGCLLAASGALERGKRAEEVGAAAGRELVRQLASGACFDEHMQDQLVVFMAMAAGTSRVLISEPTLHTRTAIQVAELLTSARFSLLPYRGMPPGVRSPLEGERPAAAHDVNLPAGQAAAPRHNEQEIPGGTQERPASAHSVPGGVQGGVTSSHEVQGRMGDDMASIHGVPRHRGVPGGTCGSPTGGLSTAHSEKKASAEPRSESEPGGKEAEVNSTLTHQCWVLECEGAGLGPVAILESGVKIEAS